MEEKIKTAIETALHNCFGDETTIYAQKSTQAMKKPCAFVLFKKSTIQPLIMGRGILSAAFEIEMHSKNGTNDELAEMAEKAMNAIKTVENEGEKYFAFSAGISVENEKACIEAQYRICVYEAEEASELMEKLETKEE